MPLLRAFPFWAPATPGRNRKKGLRWVVAADGILVKVWRNKARRKRKGKQEPKDDTVTGTAPREVKVGVVGELDERGRTVRGSQWYHATMAEGRTFRRQIRSIASARGVRDMDETVVLSDAGSWLPALGRRQFPKATVVRDYYHAVEHLGVMGGALYGQGKPESTGWQREMARRLKEEGAQALVAEWEAIGAAPQDRQVWRRELNYFRKNRDEMDYPRYRAAQLPIGSGSAEGGCKHTVGERFKLPGTRWSEEGLLNLLPLRVAYCNRALFDP